MRILPIAALLCVNIFFANTLAAHVIQVDISGIVNPISVETVASALDQAGRAHADAVIVRLSSPGGLPDSTREIVELILRSKTPVITWVGPAGTRAASAGLILLEAGDIAAMAPDTSTAINQKVENHAAGLMRTIAAHRGRNVRAVKQGVGTDVLYTEREALEMRLIDVTAPDPISLLRALDGREITRFDGHKQTLHFADTRVIAFEPTLRQHILTAIADPNIALLLVVLGALGVYAEFSAPGLVVPGVLGSVLGLLGLGALAVFPIGWLGASLAILGLAFFVLEAKFTTHGILTVGGAIALVLSAMLLIGSDDPTLRIRLSTALGVTIPFALITSFLFSMAVRARRNKVVTGLEAMPGRSGVAVGELNPSGTVMIQGEYWNAVSRSRIGPAERVRVTAVDGAALTLQVEPLRPEQAKA